MGRHDVVVKWDRVLNELHDARGRAQWKNLVGAYMHASLAGSGMVLQEFANLLEDLFHYCVLSEIVITSFELHFPY